MDAIAQLRQLAADAEQALSEPHPDRERLVAAAIRALTDHATAVKDTLTPEQRSEALAIVTAVDRSHLMSFAGAPGMEHRFPVLELPRPESPFYELIGSNPDMLSWLLERMNG